MDERPDNPRDERNAAPQQGLDEADLPECGQAAEQRRREEFAQTVGQLGEGGDVRLVKELQSYPAESRARYLELEARAELLELTRDAIIVHDLTGRIVYWNRASEATYEWSRDEVLGRNIHSLLDTSFGTPLDEIHRALHRDGHWQGELTHTGRHGQQLVMMSRWMLRRDRAGEPAGILEVNSDITARVHAERSLELQRRRLTTVLNLIPGYVAIKDAEFRVRFANHGFLERFGEPGEHPCYEVQYGRSSRCPGCGVEKVFATGRSREWEAVCSDGRWFHVWAHPFTDSDGSPAVLELGIDVTEQRDAQRYVSEISDAERRRVGRDLHDTLGQKLAGAGFLLRGLMSRVKQASPDDAETADRLAEILNESVAHVRSLARGLDPVSPAGAGLEGGLRELARGAREVYGLQVEVAYELADRLAEFPSLQLYRIAQEAVGNAARHAGARSIRVSVSDSDDAVELKVADDGVGLPDDAPAEGMGMRTMKHRAGALGGRLIVSPGPDGGTEVTCTISKQLIQSEDDSRWQSARSMGLGDPSSRS